MRVLDTVSMTSQYETAFHLVLFAQRQGSEERTAHFFAYDFDTADEAERLGQAFLGDEIKNGTCVAYQVWADEFGQKTRTLVSEMEF